MDEMRTSDHGWVDESWPPQEGFVVKDESDTSLWMSKNFNNVAGDFPP